MMMTEWNGQWYHTLAQVRVNMISERGGKLYIEIAVSFADIVAIKYGIRMVDNVPRLLMPVHFLAFNISH